MFVECQQRKSIKSISTKGAKQQNDNNNKLRTLGWKKERQFAGFLCAMIISMDGSGWGATKCNTFLAMIMIPEYLRPHTNYACSISILCIIYVHTYLCLRGVVWYLCVYI